MFAYNVPFYITLIICLIAGLMQSYQRHKVCPAKKQDRGFIHIKL
jgi:hypothetical protein